MNNRGAAYYRQTHRKRYGYRYRDKYSLGNGSYIRTYKHTYLSARRLPAAMAMGVSSTRPQTSPSAYTCAAPVFWYLSTYTYINAGMYMSYRLHACEHM
jgi:hypothetical protein